jgi:hypothetical protein
MNYIRFNELFHEFARFVEQLHTLYLDSLSGFSVLHERLLDHQATMARLLNGSELAEEKFQDTCSMRYEDLCSKRFAPVALWTVMKQGHMKERLKDNGTNTVLLGRQCLVSAYGYWEEYLRPEVGKALGVLSLDANGRSEESRRILNTISAMTSSTTMERPRARSLNVSCCAGSRPASQLIFAWSK